MCGLLEYLLLLLLLMLLLLLLLLLLLVVAMGSWDVLYWRGSLMTIIGVQGLMLDVRVVDLGPLMMLVLVGVLVIVSVVVNVVTNGFRQRVESRLGLQRDCLSKMLGVQISLFRRDEGSGSGGKLFLLLLLILGTSIRGV